MVNFLALQLLAAAELALEDHGLLCHELHQLLVTASLHFFLQRRVGRVVAFDAQERFDVGRDVQHCVMHQTIQYRLLCLLVVLLESIIEMDVKLRPARFNV